MSRRCERCALQDWLCICHLVGRQVHLTGVLTMVVHYKEARRASNTAQLLRLGIENLRWIEHGRQDARLQHREVFESDKAPLVLFPCDGAVDVRELPDRREGWNLIVPDGSWRQAAKIGNRLRAMGAQPVRLSSCRPSQYRLRQNPHRDRLCTLEAVLAALAILEPEVDFQALTRAFETFVTRLLWQRGKLSLEDAAEFLPEVRGRSAEMVLRTGLEPARGCPH